MVDFYFLIEKIKKELYEFSKEVGIKFMIEISFLDLNLNTYNNTFYPYRKPNNEINYIITNRITRKQ